VINNPKQSVEVTSKNQLTRDEWTMTGAIATNRTAPPIPFESHWVRAEWADAEIERLSAETARLTRERDELMDRLHQPCKSCGQ
jgi:hypothetical protein